MQEIRYIRFVLLQICALLLCTASFIYIVNPLGVYGTPVIRGFNHISPAATAYARMKKIEDIKRLKPEVLLTGTSRADSAFDLKLHQFDGLRPYNAALPASTLHEQRRMIEFAQRVQPLRKLIVTLDFLSFNALRLENKQFDPDMLSPAALSPMRSFINTYGTLLSFDMLIAGRKHLRYIKQLNRRSVILDNGRKVNTDVAYRIEHNGAWSVFYNNNAFSDHRTDDFSFSYSEKPHDDTFQHLQAILNLARQHGTDVILLIMPVHQYYRDQQHQSGFSPLLKAWRKRLIKLIRDNAIYHDAKPYPLWDFNYQNRYTMEPIPPKEDIAPEMQWFWDASHIKPAFGDLILKKILHFPAAPQNFGKKLT